MTMMQYSAMDAVSDAHVTQRIDPIIAGMEGLRSLMQKLSAPSYRADQLYRYALRGVPLDSMSTLPAALRAQLSDILTDSSVAIERAMPADNGDCVKYLYRLSDGQMVEGVRMRYHHGDTLCVSTQAGCRMGCAFCASTLDGLARNLSPGEMIGQITAANAADKNTIIHNIVLMGSGEPLDNYTHVVSFLCAIRESAGLNIGMRRVSLSTCGIADAIERFASENLPVTLCISLHAPDDSIRQSLMPIAKRYPLAQLMSSCKTYLRASGRRVIFEYALIDGVNDGIAHARQLAQLMHGMQHHINLIPLNPIPERGFRPSSEQAAARFLKELITMGISATRRRTLGLTVDAACGQLRRRAIKPLQ